jgi:endonuclease G
MKRRYDHCSACGGGHSAEDFDAQTAFENLARKQEQLAQIMAQYMSEAKLKRPLRVENARAMADSVMLEIVGGQPIPQAVHSDCCLVGQVNPNGSTQWYCTGVLIHPRVVLTAAHCLNPGLGRFPNIVALNTASARNADLANADIIKLLRPPMIHPFFNQAQNDIAVLILRNSSIVTPTPRATFNETNREQSVLVVGFGNANPTGTMGFGIKRQVEVPITLIRTNAAQDLTDVEISFGFESDVEFVAGGNGRDACTGDSGGPAYININGSKKVCGIVSRRVRNAVFECADGNIFTRLDMHQNFIENALAENGLQ